MSSFCGAGVFKAIDTSGDGDIQLGEMEVFSAFVAAYRLFSMSVIVTDHIVGQAFLDMNAQLAQDAV